MEQVLVEQFIRNRQLPPAVVEAATKALQKRAENPRFKATATVAINQAFPL